MKVLLVSDYFYPFTPGGSEWSVYELARALKANQVESIVATLNYGAEPSAGYHGIKILRIPSLKKLKHTRSVVNPIWQNNPIFFVTSAVHLIKVVRKENPDIIHVHGKFLIPAGIITGLITKKPVIVSIRDKQLLCSLGKCFFNKNRMRACNFIEYLTSDFPWFYKNYVTNKNLTSLVYTLLGAIWTRLAAVQIAYLAKRASAIIAISNSQKKYLEANGFKKVVTIYNTAPFSKSKSLVSKEKKVLFVGKLSLGKGAQPLLDAISKIVKKTKVKFIFTGTVDVKQSVQAKMKNEIFKNSTKFLGPVPHQKLTTFYKNSSLVVMPSIYPEAFGRVALEALAVGTPVVVSDRGGLPEIVDDRITGRVIDPTAEDLAEAIIDILENEKRYKDNIKREYTRLKNKFETTPLKMHLKLYNQLLK